MIKQIIVFMVLFFTVWAPSLFAQSVEPSIIPEIAGSQLNYAQYQNILFAKYIIKRDCKLDCSNLTLTTLGIMWQESHAGVDGPIGDISNGFGLRSYGVMQIKLNVAMKMLRLHPIFRYAYFQHRTITYDEVIARLILDNKFNILTGIYYIEYLHTKYRLTWNTTIRAYNQGYGGKWNKKASEYLANVQKVMRENNMLELAKGT